MTQQVASPQETGREQALPLPEPIGRELTAGGAANRFLNLILALMFLPPALLVMGAFLVLVKAACRDKGPFLYRGIRLGKDKREFIIYKIRTLALGAEQSLGSELYTPGGSLELPFGSFLRRSRLDELPQLFNILKGDMDFIGPRPVRPAVYERNRAHIRNYDQRFLVKPGLTGFSQFFTPHKTPKRIRFIIDNHYIKKKANPLWEVAFILWTGLTVLRNSLAEAGRGAADSARTLLARGSARNLRRLRRVTCSPASLALLDERTRTPLAGHHCLVDINYEAVSLASDLQLEPGQRLILDMNITHPKARGIRRVRCRAFVHARLDQGRTQSPDHAPPNHYVLFYEPLTDFNRYLVDQYILGESIA